MTGEPMVFVVGIGPGGRSHMTGRALEALFLIALSRGQSEQVRRHLETLEQVHSHMGRRAIDLLDRAARRTRVGR